MNFLELAKARFSVRSFKKDPIEEEKLPINSNIVPIMAAQTTQKLTEWKNSLKVIKKLYTNVKIFDTICNVTEIRQIEAKTLRQLRIRSFSKKFRPKRLTGAI